MPIGEIAGEILGGVLRVIGRALAEVVFEVLIKGLGYLICRPFSRSLNPDGVLVTVVGLIAWALLLFALYFGYDLIFAKAEVDRCLESGGSYNHQIDQCYQPIT